MQALNRSYLTVVTIVFCLLMMVASEVGATDGVKAVIVPTERNGVEIWVDKDCYENGEYLTIHFQAERSGYLTIYDFTPDGRSFSIFPNAYYLDNRIRGGIEYSLPAPDDPFHIQVDVPLGVPSDATEILWAVITEEKLSLPAPKGGTPRGLTIEVRDALDELGYSSWWASDMCEFRYGPCGESPVEEPKSENFALLIGINDYIDKWAPSPDDPSVKVKFPKLRGCVPDVKGVARFLESEYDHIRLILDHEATYEGIKEGFTDWLSAAGPDSKVLIYYSGHGATKADKNGDEDDGLDETLVPYNWADGRRFVLDDEISDWVEALRAKEVLLVIDSCHSGTIVDIAKGLIGLQIRTYQVSYLDRGYLPLSSDKSIEDFKVGARALDDDKTVISLQACEAAESAYEVKLEDEYHGLFTYFNLQALEGKVSGGSALRVTARDMFEYSREKVAEFTTGWHEDDPRVAVQNPTLEATTLDDIVVLTRE